MMDNFYLLTVFKFQNKRFQKNSVRNTIRVMNTIRVTNSLNLDQDHHSVGPDLDPNCLEMLSADNKTYH